jgi:hypothetical protein
MKSNLRTFFIKCEYISLLELFVVQRITHQLFGLAEISIPHSSHKGWFNRKKVIEICSDKSNKWKDIITDKLKELK